jgi:hypothetical protein
VTARGNQRIAKTDLELKPMMARRRSAFDFVGVGKRGEQRLRLFDLGKLRRRGKTFECRGENGVRIGGAVG